MHTHAATRASDALVKVPAVTLGFWVLKIAATTLGEIGGDAVSMSMQLGYLLATFIFALAFVIFVTLQIRATRFQPALYWATIVATTTLGTTLADFCDRSLGIGYAGGASLLLVLLLTSLFLWHRIYGTVAVASVATLGVEIFYWVTILFSQTLGTALGDWTADTLGAGFGGASLLFVLLLTLTATGLLWKNLSRTFLFWTAFVLTRPLGATVGDLLDKPIAEGGLALSRYSASLALLLFMVAGVWLFKQRAASHVH